MEVVLLERHRLPIVEEIEEVEKEIAIVTVIIAITIIVIYQYQSLTSMSYCIIELSFQMVSDLGLSQITDDFGPN